VFDHPIAQQRLDRLREALAARRVVRFKRHASAGTVLRRVNPYGLVHRAGAWYLVGYCHARQRVDTFRVRDLDDLAVLDEAFERPPGYRLPPEGAAGEPQERVVQVLFDTEAAPWLRGDPFVHDHPARSP
jgi:predicted DNA-binding transcriptional regulator YafY